MRWSSFALLSGLAVVSSAQKDQSGAVIKKVAPPTPNPAGCLPTREGEFILHVVDLPQSGKSLSRRAEEAGAPPVLVTLKNGIMKDAKNRIGYIASNRQFQFDGPPQAGAIYTGGWCVFENNTVALGGSSVLYRCLSGSFYNLYDQHNAKQCEAIHIQVAANGGDVKSGSDGQPSNVNSGSDGHPSTNGQVNSGADGQPSVNGKIVATSLQPTNILTQLSDGQPQVIQTQVPVPICEINDGQLQVRTGPCAQPTARPAINPIKQISDGQIQAPTGSPAPPPPPPPSPLPPKKSSVAPAPIQPTLKPSPTQIRNITSVPVFRPSTTRQPIRPQSTLKPQVPTAKPHQPTVQPQQPTSSPTNAPVPAGASLVAPGPAISLIAALVGMVAFL